MDGPRTLPGAAQQILQTLERFGLAWDGEVVVQQNRLDVYAAALERLRLEGWAYGCACTRREMADSALARDGGRIYPGTCREGVPRGRAVRAWRLRVPEGLVRFEDGVQGPVVENVAREVGDFVLLRADGQFAYQLAVVMDDAAAGVTHVVRGADLLDSTARQIVLQRALEVAQPAYAHLPVVVNEAGEKLSKQTLAQSVDDHSPGPALVEALAFLGQSPPQALRRASPAEVLAWGVAHWQLARVPRQRAAPLPRG